MKSKGNGCMCLKWSVTCSENLRQELGVNWIYSGGTMIDHNESIIGFDKGCQKQGKMSRPELPLRRGHET